MTPKKLESLWLQLLEQAKQMSQAIRSFDEYGDFTDECDNADKLIARIEKAVEQK